ncbi:dihydrolipoamide dehydrogenase [Anaeromyxobacter dehalogenans 2CP-1]|uniref:Dihydrolipoyl dehydrogenase n=1 Tax=Anaeromyxobacter dehalogenans (strain ATCC BAA-258 / DSM 21875 / 2CP-1) TaxID=455488 RepID=B8J943_ANAD2|nr:dihydrolipoyl dehydrogenase [Anaeromyxobacter dehalogenans]ACL65449.1 dihydrolipoamide dehydrogenase [Anaeromyxobacter dehalogenans 2CP-1]
MPTQTYDAIVIGAGTGGYPAAIRLAQLGKKVALIEKDATLGGVCLNWGCIPSKALIAAANLVDEMRGAADRGIIAEPPRVDVAKLREFKDGVVKKLTGGVALLEKGNGVEVVRGTATVVAPNAVEVAGKDGQKTRLEAGAILVATGARPIEIPGFAFDGKDVWSAREAVDLPEVPKRLVCIGGGIIGMELGTVYAKLGAQVTFVEALPQVLTGVDPDAVRLVQKGLRQRGVAVHVNAKAKGYERRGKELVVKIEIEGKEQEIPCDKILVAVGFKPSSAGFGLEQVGVKIGPKGFIEVDQQYRTSVPTIFAAGDVTGPPLLAHKASKEGEIAAEVIAGHKTVRDWVGMPTAIFTDPEVAAVGLSEEEARKQGYDPIVGKFAFGALGRAIAIHHTEGFVKVVGDRKTKLLLGASICGPEAGDLIAEAALALEMGAYLEDVALTIHAHPTLPEALNEACRAALGEAIHMLNRPERPKKGEAAAGARA